MARPPPQSNPLLPGKPLPGKPVVSTFPTPDLRDRIYVVKRDSRLPENASPPEKGSSFAGPEAEKFEGWVFATRRPTDQIGWVNDFYINERKNQEDYNYEIDYPYTDSSYPRLTRMYIYLREDFKDMPEPNLDEFDSVFTSLRLVAYEQVRFFIQRDLTASDDVIDPILDSLFIGIQKIYEVRPMEIVDHETSEAFGFGGVMQHTKRTDVPGQNVESGINVVESKTEKRGLNTELLETIKLAGDDNPWLELIHGGSGYTTAPIVSFSGDAPGLGGGAATAHISTVGPTDPTQTITLRRSSFGDNNGVFFFIAKLENGGTWQNPYNNGVAITSEELALGNLEGLTDRKASSIATRSVPHPTIEFDLGAHRKLQCTGVDFRQTSDNDFGTTNLSLQGSNDGMTWDSLAPVTPVKTKNKWVHVDVDTNKFYRRFRIRGKDSANRRLTIGELELYGKLHFQAAGAGSGVVTSVTVTNAGNYLTEPAVLFVGGGGSGAVAHAVLNGSDLVSIVVDEGGYGYSSAPTVALSGGTGAQAYATAELGFGVGSIAVDTPGSDYTIPPGVQIEGDGAGATAIALLGKSLESILVTTRGSGYDDPPVVSFANGGGTGAAGTAVLGFPVDSVEVTDGGSGYTSEPTVEVSDEGDFGLDAAFRALRALPVASVAMVTGGSGYTSAPTVGFAGGDGSGATADAVLGFGIDTIGVDSGGSGYTTPPMVVITGDGSGATATAILTADAVTSIVVTNPGSGYTTPPIISISGDGSGAAATAVLLTLGAVVRVDMTAAGSDYTTPPDITFTGGAGTGASAISLLDDSATGRAIGRILILNEGSGYTAPPTLTLTGGGGSGATADATLSSLGDVVAVTLDNPGSGYAFAPDISFAPPGSGDGAEATAILASTGGVGFVSVITPGEGYTTAPTISFIGGDGTGAAATATLESTGSVIGLTLDEPGSYDVAPTVIFTGDGTGAEAIYHLAASWAKLYETETDPREKIVIEMEKDIVPAGTLYPGSGFVDIKSIDMWRSVQITSKVDLHHLPPPETVPGSHRLDLPDSLVSIAAEFGQEQSLGWRVNTGFKTAQASVAAYGAIKIGRKAGFSGVAGARITRQFFFGPPPLGHIPCAAIIRPSSGSVVLRTQQASASATGGTPGGFSRVEVSGSIVERVDVVNVSGILTGTLHSDLSSTIVRAAQTVDDSIGGTNRQNLRNRAISSVPSPHLLGIDTVWPPQVIADTNAQATLTIDIPSSTPHELLPGRSLLVAVEVEKWRLGLYVLTLVYVIVPDEDCVPVLPLPTPVVAPVAPTAWWAFESLGGSS